MPVEHIVVIADLFNCNDSNQPLSSTPLNKLMTAQVLLQKYHVLKHSQWEQAAGPRHLGGNGKNWSIKGDGRQVQKGVTYNGL